ncbi:hypothetical protein LSAT2_002169 [Lamellibrachia satsuma]|nr:hypothetical protein LSAT2_002169 [Lamellibrachia satsuma]
MATKRCVVFPLRTERVDLFPHRPSRRLIVHHGSTGSRCQRHQRERSARRRRPDDNDYDDHDIDDGSDDNEMMVLLEMLAMMVMVTTMTTTTTTTVVMRVQQQICSDRIRILNRRQQDRDSVATGTTAPACPVAVNAAIVTVRMRTDARQGRQSSAPRPWRHTSTETIVFWWRRRRCWIYSWLSALLARNSRLTGAFRRNE